MTAHDDQPREQPSPGPAPMPGAAEAALQQLIHQLAEWHQHSATRLESLAGLPAQLASLAEQVRRLSEEVERLRGEHHDAAMTSRLITDGEFGLAAQVREGRQIATKAAADAAAAKVRAAYLSGAAVAVAGVAPWVVQALS